MWNLVTSFYTSLPYYGASLMNAGEPWSGNYEVMTPIWGTAHHTQFSEPGWTFLKHGSGTGVLTGGGTYVTYLAPADAGKAQRHWTMVAEKIRDTTGPCLRDDYKVNDMAEETISFTLGAELVHGPIQTWRSDWSTGHGIDDLFQPGPILVPKMVGGKAVVTVAVRADQVVTLSSLPRATHGKRGAAPTPPPASAPFPSSYANDFDNATLNSEEAYLSDQAGKWEIRADKAGGQVLSHVSPEIGVVYRGDVRPVSVLGSPDWKDAEASLRFRIEDTAAKGFWVSLRTLNHGAQYPACKRPACLPQATNIRGVYLVLELSGAWKVCNSTYAVDPSTPPPDAALSGRDAPLKLNAWYNVTISVKDEQLAWSLQPDDDARKDAAPPVSRTLKLATGVFPTAGQLGIGLADYGLASIDALRVSGTA